ncbi:MAG TPA: F0F1 ATP synthase subunit B [Verrucomicrobiota bacterium]|nr:F0F1 ATP synthase subunit B [Verrucomicrobiota bacterium]
MEYTVFFAAGDLVDLAKSTGETFGFSWQLFISQCISFAIVCFALHRFAYKPILKVLEERRAKIAEGLANAEKIKQELASAQAKAQEILSAANAQGNKLIEEARQSAAKVLETESQKAIATANDIVTKARQASEAELVRMKAELRKEVGRLVVATSAKVTGGILTAEQQSRLAEDTAKQLASN